MFLNRHFCIMVLCVVFICSIFWWQQPVNVVTAMATGGYADSPQQFVKECFQKLDYRQFELAKKLMTEDAYIESLSLVQRLRDNPFLSMQKIVVQSVDHSNFLVTITLGSSIDPQEEVNYEVEVNQADIGLIITSIKARQ
ncbi:MAG: hypothetical protein GX207_05055 [Peptococcaceae bacterium]|nr:hypothetical protein [Peptococcaceae bacterium]